MAWFNRLRGNVQHGATRRPLAKWRPRIETLEDRRLLATFSVDHTGDNTGQSCANPADNDDCSLRSAVELANANSEADTITFDLGSYPAAISLGDTGNDIAFTTSYLTTIDAPLDGSGNPGVTVRRSLSASTNFRVFTIGNGAWVEMYDIKITNGRSHLGGGIQNDGTLELHHTTVTGNTALPALNPDIDCGEDPCSAWNWGSLGGGIYNANEADLTVEDGSKITDNKVVGDDDGDLLQFFQGAGIYNAADATLSISGNEEKDIEITGNTVCPVQPATSEPNDCNPMLLGLDDGGGTLYFEGGGIYNKGGDGDVIINFATISGNTVNAWLINDSTGYSSHGGGVIGGRMLIANSTISDNLAFMDEDVESVTGLRRVAGGGIHGGYGLTIVNCTIADNTVNLQGDGGGRFYPTGGGYWMKTSDAGDVEIMWTTIAHNQVISENEPAIDSGGGGIGIANDSGQGPILYNTIVAENTVDFPSTPIFEYPDSYGPDINGDVSVNSTFNLVGNGTGSNFLLSCCDDNIVGTGGSPIDPVLDAALGSNGGSTETLALSDGSPAIDAGNNTNAPDYDQRGTGFERIENSTTDMGAFECQDEDTDCYPALAAHQGPERQGAVLFAANSSFDPPHSINSVKAANSDAILPQYRSTIDAGVQSGEETPNVSTGDTPKAVAVGRVTRVKSLPNDLFALSSL